MKTVFLTHGMMMGLIVGVWAVACQPISKAESEKNQSDLLGSYTEVPGYIVELIDIKGQVTIASISEGGEASEITHEYAADSFCIGAHIGGGFILTAGHCVFSRVCSSDPSDLYGLGLRYPTSDGAAQVMDNSSIEAIVFHEHLIKVSSDKTLAMPSHSLAHDIALIKVRSIPFKSAARIPLSSEQHFAPINISGRYYMFQPQPEQTSTSFRGSMGSALISSKSTIISTIMSQIQSEFHKLNPKFEYFSPLAVEKSYSPAPLFTGYPACYSLGANGALEDISEHSFSEDGMMDVDPSLAPGIRQNISSFGTIYEQLKKPVHHRDQTILTKAGEEGTRIFMANIEHSIILEPGGSGDGVAEFCPGHSGGPVVQQGSGGMDDVVVAVISHGLTHTHDDHGEVVNRCSQLEGTVSTYHNLSWIKAVKALMSAGGLGGIEQQVQFAIPGTVSDTMLPKQ